MLGGRTIPMPAVNLHRIKRRFHAWWEGYDLPADEDAGIYPEAAPPSAPAATATPAPVAAESAWPPARLTATQWLWGEGFSFPGGGELALELVRPFHLQKGNTLLDIGCGLGGGARAVAKALGVVVTALEPQPDLAAAGKAASEAARAKKTAPVAAWQPGTGTLPPGPFDAVFVRQVLGQVEDKPALVAALAKLLKPGGQIMFVELAFPRPDAASPALDSWRGCEDEAPHPPLLEDIAAALVKERIDVRLAEDMSPAFRTRVQTALASLASRLDGGLTRDEGRFLLREIERWARRLAACEAGDLRIARVHGQRKA